jgi:hypothetical protein
MPRPHRATASPAQAFTVEGALIAPAVLAKIAMRSAEEQTDAAYRIPRGLTLRDEIARSFQIGEALFADFDRIATPSAGSTTRFVASLFREVFGFSEIGQGKSGSASVSILEGLGGRVPVVVVPPGNGLDRVTAVSLLI